jgi:hypothetical protein
MKYFNATKPSKGKQAVAQTKILSSCGANMVLPNQEMLSFHRLPR